MRREVRRIQNIMRRDPGIDGDAQRLGQLSWILFLATLEGLKASRQAAVQWARVLSCARAGDNLLTLVRHEIFPHLRSESGPSRWIAETFQDIEVSFTSPAVLRDVIVEVDDLLSKASGDRFIISDIYESILSDLGSAGNSGEFYTPRAIVEFVAETVGIRSGDTVYDPACGTAGFLVAAAQYASRNGLSVELAGTEKKALPHLLAMTNLLLHTGKPPTSVRRENALAPSSLLRASAHDVIITNPPFGGEEEAGVEDSFPSNLRTRSTADLFVSAIVDGLRPGGRAAIILPDGFLYGEGVSGRIRKRLFDEGNLSRLVRLPEGVFSPYTGIRTNVLYFEKAAAPSDLRVHIHEGPSDAKRYTRTRPIKRADLEQARNWSEQGEGANDFAVSRESLAKTEYNLDIKAKRGGSVKGDVDQLRRLYADAHEDLKAARAHIASMLADERLANQTGASKATLVASICERKTQIDKAWDLALHAAYIGGRWAGSSRKERANDEVAGESDSHWPFQAPDGFHWCLLEEVGRVAGGATPAADDPANFEPAEVPWLTPADLNGHVGRLISNGKRALSTKGFQSCSSELLPAGTVLFSSRAPIGYCAIAEAPLATNQGFKSVIPNGRASSEYIYFYLQFARPVIEEMASGTTFKEVSGAKMRRVPFLLPSKEVQEEIVNYLSLLEESFAGLRRAITTRDNVTERVIGDLHSEINH